MNRNTTINSQLAVRIHQNNSIAVSQCPDLSPVAHHIAVVNQRVKQKFLALFVLRDDYYSYPLVTCRVRVPVRFSALFEGLIGLPISGGCIMLPELCRFAAPGIR